MIYFSVGFFLELAPIVLSIIFSLLFYSFTLLTTYNAMRCAILSYMSHHLDQWTERFTRHICWCFKYFGSGMIFLYSLHLMGSWNSVSDWGPVTVLIDLCCSFLVVGSPYTFYRRAWCQKRSTFSNKIGLTRMIEEQKCSNSLSRPPPSHWVRIQLLSEGLVLITSSILQVYWRWLLVFSGKQFECIELLAVEII